MKAATAATWTNDLGRAAGEFRLGVSGARYECQPRSWPTWSLRSLPVPAPLPGQGKVLLAVGTDLCEPCTTLSVVPFSAGHLNCNFVHVTCCNLNRKSTYTGFFATPVILALLFAAWAGLCPRLRVHYVNFVFKLQAACLWVLWRCRWGSGVRRGMAGSWVRRSWGSLPVQPGLHGVSGAFPLSPSRIWHGRGPQPGCLEPRADTHRAWSPFWGVSHSIHHLFAYLPLGFG